jgi:E3 ubiquitin-protein ligase CHFR
MSSAPNENESEPPSAPAPVAAEEVHVGRSASPEAINSAAAITSPVSPATSTKSLKRTADMMDDDEDRQDSKRKRISDGNEDGGPEASTSKTTNTAPDGTDANRLVKEIGDELLCGCCSALCYNPVLVLPCQHYYCGR